MLKYKQNMYSRRQRLLKAIAKLHRLKRYDKGTYVARLGVKPTTPCFIGRSAGTLARAKRLLSPRPPGALLCHRCDEPKCRAIEHLFWGTHADNTHDMLLKRRSRGKFFVQAEIRRLEVLIEDLLKEVDIRSKHYK